MIAAGVILFSGIKYWAVWIGDAEKVQSWLSPWFMAIRQLAALLVFWIPAVIFAKKTDRNSRTFSGWIIFLYAVVFSLIGFDLVMPLEKHWVSTLFGGYFFISGLYLAAAAWCLLSILTATIDQKEQLADQGKLMLAFCMLTTYMLFSQLVVLWYENVPRETSFLVPRMNISGWHILSVVLICMVYIGPITLLLWKELKYSKIYMGIVSSVILTGMWLERWWLVMPSVDEKLSIGLSETAVTAMFAAAFGLSYSIGLRYITVKNGRKD
jgi:hypothetical protein